MGRFKVIHVKGHTRTLPTGKTIKVKPHERTIFVPNLGKWSPTQDAETRMKHLKEVERGKFNAQQNPRRAKLLVRQDLEQLADFTTQRKVRKVAQEDSRRLLQQIESL